MFFGNAVESVMQSYLFATHCFFDVGGSLHKPIRPSLEKKFGPMRDRLERQGPLLFRR